MLTLALTAAEIMLCAAIALTLWRLARGPDLEDRVLALDTLYINTVALLLVYGIDLGIALYYEAALLIALLGFIGTVSLAKFRLRGDVIE
jgi:multicomponent K+:H+ antiporter subunit F